MRTFIQRIAVFFIAMAWGVTYAYCQPDTTRLENLSLKELLNVKVITASKTLQALSLTPATVILVTKEQIKMRGYQSLLDVMYDLPGVKVDDKIYPGIRNSFTIRGTQGSEKLIILLDGIIISSPSGEAMPIMENYPVNLAEQIEIVFGPASALYGANAVSGVINIITKKNANKDIHIEASSLAGTYGYTNSSLFITKKLSSQAQLVIAGQYFYDRNPDYSSLYSGDSLLSNTPYKTGLFNTIYGPMAPETPFTPRYEAPVEAYNIYGALRIQDFSFSYFRNYFKLPSAYSNNTSNAIYNKEVFIAQSIHTANASYKKTFNNITSTTSITANEYTLDPRSNYRNLYTNMEPGYKYATSSMIKAEELVDIKMSEALNLSAGAGYEKYYSIPQSGDLKEPVNKDEYLHGSYLGTESYYKPGGLEAQFYFIRYHNIGTYLQAQYSPSAKLHITAGTRYDYNSRYGSTLNPRLGIVYKPLSRTTIKLLYGSAFLAPTPSNAYVQYGSFNTQDSGKTYHSYFLHMPNPGLKPIRSYNAEASIQQYLSDNMSITLNGYYTVLTGLYAFADDNSSTQLYNNMFNGIPVDYVEVFINQDKQQNLGGSILLNWKYSFGRVHINSTASASYVNGVVKTGGQQAIKDKELDFISPFMFRLVTDMKTGKFTCSPRLILIGKQHLTGIADDTKKIMQRQTIPGYALLNVSLAYAFQKNISCFANITNALNQQYRAVGFNMDLTNNNTDLFYGQRQDPLRIMAGFRIGL